MPVAAQLLGIAVRGSRLEGDAHAVAFEFVDARKRSGTVLGRHEGRRAGDDRRCDAIRETNAVCSAIAPPTAVPASATLSLMPSPSSSAMRSSVILSIVSGPRIFSEKPAPRVS